MQFQYLPNSGYHKPSGDFRRNRQFRQNRQSPRGHFWHPTQTVRGWRFFAIFAIFAIVSISGQEWRRTWNILTNTWFLDPIENVWCSTAFPGTDPV